MSGFFNVRQYRVLLTEGVRLTLTGSRGATGGSVEDSSRHLISAAYSLTLSTLVAGLLLHNASPGQYLLATTTLTLIFTATAIIAELSGGLFHPLDLAITGHLPIRGITRFAARFTELLLTIFLITLNLNLVPALLFYYATGGNPAAPLACLGAGFCTALFTAGMCLILYTLMARFLSVMQFQGLLLYMNIFVSLSILGLVINMGRLLQSEAFRHATDGAFSFYYPPAWFAGSAMKLLGLGSSGGVVFLAAGLGLCAALLPLVIAALGSERLIQTLDRGGTSGRTRSAPGPVMALFEKLFVRDHDRAAFEFTAVNLSRDRGFRIMAYPILGIPVLIIALSLFEERHPLFFVLMLHLMNIYQFLVVSFLPYGDHFRGSWIFDAHPADPPNLFAVGAEKAFTFRIALPLFVINTLALAVVWSPLDGLLNAFCAFVTGLFVAGARFRALWAYPFAREFRGAVAKDLAGGGVEVYFLFALLAGIHCMVYGSYPLLAFMIVGMLLIHKVRSVRLARRPAGEGRKP